MNKFYLPRNMENLIPRLKIFLQLFFLFGISAVANSQQLPGKMEVDSNMGKTVSKLTVYTANHPIEKIYLQLNKPSYERMDTIWFKVYTVIGSAHQLSAVSGVAYAELMKDDSVIRHLNLKLESGTAASNFILPPNIESGIYHIRAYTDWMKNEGPSGFYDQPLKIGDGPLIGKATIVSTKKITAPLTNTPAEADVQFFPEGGYLVIGLRSVVAFKATNPDGSPAIVSVNITDPDGNDVAVAESGHEGMGIFAFTPQEDKSYKANIHFSNSSVQTIALPQALTEGYTFTINNRGKDTLVVKIAANTPLLKSKAGTGFYVIAQSGGKVYYTTSSKLNESVYSIRIAKNHFPTGVIRFTLFSGIGEPMNERVVFIQQPDNLNLKINSGKSTFAPGEKINLELTGSSPTNQPVIGSFSTAVISESKVPVNGATEPTIFSQLLLSSEIHGTINDPGYYLANQDDKTIADLDMLMLTQGYRKLEWKRLLDSVNKMPKYAASSGLSISGRVASINNNKPLPNAKVTLFIASKQFTLDTLTDIDGKFVFAGLDIDDAVRIIIKAKSANNSNNVNIVIDQPEKIPNSITFNKKLTSITSGTLKNSNPNDEKPSNDSKLLKEVNVNQRVKNSAPDLSYSANLNGGGNADQVVMGADLATMGCVTIAECLASKLSMVSVRGNNVSYVGRGGGGPMTVFINGTIGSLNGISAGDIYSIEVLTSVHYKAIYGHDAAHGLLLITTKRGIPDNERIPPEKTPGLVNYEFNGYYKAGSFYTPKYNSPTDAPKQDARSAIYWKPDILTDKNGKANLEFYNAGKGTYRVVVEGIDDEGHLGRQVFRYTVE